MIYKTFSGESIEKEKIKEKYQIDAVFKLLRTREGSGGKKD